MLPVFGVRVSVTFRLMCVLVVLVRYRLQSGRLLGNGCSLGCPYVLVGAHTGGMINIIVSN